MAMNKTWWIIGGIVALVILGWFLTRGGGALMGGARGVDADRNADGSMTYKNDEASVTVGGNLLPSAWPTDAPSNFAGAAIQYSGESNPQTGAPGAAVIYTVNASAQEVAEFYKRELTESGWTIEGTANVGGAMVVGAKKDNRTFALSITDAGGGKVQVTVGIELR